MVEVEQSLGTADIESQCPREHIFSQLRAAECAGASPMTITLIRGMQVTSPSRRRMQPTLRHYVPPIDKSRGKRLFTQLPCHKLQSPERYALVQHPGAAISVAAT